MTTLMAPLFRRELIALQDAGLVRRDATTGRIFDSSPPEAPAVPTVRVSLELHQPVVEMLDKAAAAWGVTRAAAAERILSGVQRGGARSTDPPTSGERLAIKPPNA